jgi:WD40 repeat protein
MRAGEVRFFHTSNWREEPRRMVRLPNPNDLAFSLAFTRDGLMAMGSALGALEVRDMATGEQLWYRGTAHDRSKAIVKAAFSPDGGRLATASSDETARVWDARTGELLLTLAGHGLNVLSVAWHPDGKRLLTVGMDDTAKLWDTETGREIVTLLATQGQTRLMGGTFSPDGHSAFIATSNGTVTRIDTLAWQERLAQCGEADELLRCIELVKRQTRLNPATTEADILW